MVIAYQRKTNEFYRKQISELEDSLTLVQNQRSLELFKDLPFYFWNKPKTQQHNTFVGTVGLPVKNNIEHGLYDFEQEIIEYLEADNPSSPKNKHLYILKSSGLGITTLLLYYIGWKCTTNNDWSNGRVCILTAPRLDLTIDLVDRLKAIFTRKELLQFDSRNTICNINSCKIEAFPSHLGLKGMRGLTDIKMIVCDEASFFNDSEISECRDTIERYWAKSNPLIVLCSTPNKPNDLMDIIKKEAEDKCIYHRMYLDYSVGLDKIYSQQEIALQRLSPSFRREYDLAFAGMEGNVFHVRDIDSAIARGIKYYNDKVNRYTQKSMGLDPSWGSSSFGVCITELRDGLVNVLEADEYPRADFNQMLDLTVELINKYDMSFDSGARIFVDGANPEFIRALKKEVYEDENYDLTIDVIKRNTGSSFSLVSIINNMFVVPIAFAKFHREMLAHTKRILEDRGGQIAIHPTFDKLITSLRTAVEKDGKLDKDSTSHNDVFDSLRLALMRYQ